MAEPQLLFLSDADVRRLLTPAVAVELCQQALLAQAGGQVDWAVPRLMTMMAGADSTYDTRYLVKGCVLRELGVAGMRVMSKHPDRNVDGRGTKFLILGDAAAGLWRAIIDEEHQHKLRTGAAVAVAAQWLANPGATTAALVGAGPMAQTALAALAAVFPLADVRVTSRSAASRERCAAWAQDTLHLPVRPVADVAAAVADAQIVVTATAARVPILEEEWLAPGAFVYAMGDYQEAADAVYAGLDHFFADDWEQCQVRADIQRLMAAGVLAGERLSGSLWEVAGGLRPGRQSSAERILLRSQGLVTQDVTIGWWVYSQALAQGIGTVLG